MKNKIVRTRYAPSPTGFFHIGGARTALFNFLFAKANDGLFIVRIEDTDAERNVSGGIESQLENLKWLKLFFDESIENPGLYGPYIQSEKIETYLGSANKLLLEGKAYKCYCSKEELDEEKKIAISKKLSPKYSGRCLTLKYDEIQIKEINKVPWTIRLKIDSKETFSWKDLIRGEIKIPGSSMTDPILIKANKTPMYNFAASVDDDHMRISHVLRGEEHISNTPYQIAISNALGINEDIKYGHLSLIVDADRKKLSKRNSSVEQFIEGYKNLGFTPEAIVNYMCLLGWSPKDNVEIKTLNEIIDEFKIESVTSSPTMFDIKKMKWVSGEYFKNMDNITYIDFTLKFLEAELKIIKNIDDLTLIFKNKISYAAELNSMIKDLLKIEKITMKKIIDNKIEVDDKLFKLVKNLEEEFMMVDDWTDDAVDEVIKSIKENTTLKGKTLFMSIRIVTTTKESGPELLKVIQLLGKESITTNIKNFKEHLRDYQKVNNSGF